MHPQELQNMLTGKQKRHLRALGHKLKPLIQIGKKEIEAALIAETNVSLDHHELIKVKLLESCMLNKHEASETLAEACQADVAQILGKTFLLYRAANPPVIVLPKADSPSKSPSA
jgi:RNA-binding protein